LSGCGPRHEDDRRTLYYKELSGHWLLAIAFQPAEKFQFIRDQLLYRLARVTKELIRDEVVGAPPQKRPRMFDGALALTFESMIAWLQDGFFA
jgi:hypothetical protein